MLESLVSSLLVKYLGDYVEGAPHAAVILAPFEALIARSIINVPLAQRILLDELFPMDPL